MKKILFSLVAVVVIVISSGYTWYKVSYGTTPYYVQITQDGKVKKIKSNNVTSITRYNYNLIGYDKDGKSTQIKMGESHNLRHYAYLKVDIVRRKM